MPHADRNGLLLGRGRLFVEAGTLRFATVGFADLDAGEYDIAFQGLSTVILTPGTSVTHDALRLLARHGVGLLAVGEGGVRFYAGMPFGPDDSRLARRQVELWADKKTRIDVAKKMYEMRMGETLPQGDLNALRGIEGARAKAMYRNLAQQYGIAWLGRRYDRADPLAADLPNQAINHAATAIQGAAMVATASVGAVPQLGFIHEESGVAFCLDVADLFRDEVTLPVAFKAVKQVEASHHRLPVERCVRKLAGKAMRRQRVIPQMIDRIKELLADADDGGGDP
ncbi:MAG: type I-E CRISPR-associated endonuclease Cas1e [bacterium]